jgi:hypothetical protein
MTLLIEAGPELPLSGWLPVLPKARQGSPVVTEQSLRITTL